MMSDAPIGYGFRRIGVVLADDVEAAIRGVLSHDTITRIIDAERHFTARHNLAVAIADCDASDACQIMAAALDDLGAGQPDVSILQSTLRQDAASWADWASPPELETVVAAGLRKIGKTALGIKARKRLIVALWESLTDADRRAFLQGVDPSGKFRGRSA